MTLEEYNRKLEQVAKKTASVSQETMIKLGLEAKRMIVSRVQNKGENAEGEKFRPYSTTTTLVGSTSFLRKDAADKLLGSKQKRSLLEWRTVGGHHLALLPGGYKKIRELQGRQTDHVDFTVTGRMLNNISVIKSAVNLAVVGAKEETEKKKLAGNTERRGAILDLSEKEIETLKRVYNLKILQVFKENGL